MNTTPQPDTMRAAYREEEGWDTLLDLIHTLFRAVDRLHADKASYSDDGLSEMYSDSVGLESLIDDLIERRERLHLTGVAEVEVEVEVDEEAEVTS